MKRTKEAIKGKEEKEEVENGEGKEEIQHVSSQGPLGGLRAPLRGPEGPRWAQGYQSKNKRKEKKMPSLLS